MTRYSSHQPSAVTLGYQHHGRYESATLTTDFLVERPSLPFSTAFFLTSAGDRTWQRFAATAHLDAFPGWVHWPSGGVEYGCWLSGLDHDDADALRCIVGQQRLIRWNYWAVTIWPIPDDPHRVDLAWVPGVHGSRSCNPAVAPRSSGVTRPAA